MRNEPRAQPACGAAPRHLFMPNSFEGFSPTNYRLLPERAACFLINSRSVRPNLPLHGQQQRHGQGADSGVAPLATKK